jgi:hypothetical protein
MQLVLTVTVQCPAILPAFFPNGKRFLFFVTLKRCSFRAELNG